VTMQRTVPSGPRRGGGGGGRGAHRGVWVWVAWQVPMAVGVSMSRGPGPLRCLRFVEFSSSPVGHLSTAAPICDISPRSLPRRAHAPRPPPNTSTDRAAVPVAASGALRGVGPRRPGPPHRFRLLMRRSRPPQGVPRGRQCVFSPLSALFPPEGLKEQCAPIPYPWGPMLPATVPPRPVVMHRRLRERECVCEWQCGYPPPHRGAVAIDKVTDKGPGGDAEGWGGLAGGRSGRLALLAAHGSQVCIIATPMVRLSEVP